MTARIVAALACVVAGVAVLAHAAPGTSWQAVAGWLLLLAAFVNLATMRDRRAHTCDYCRECDCCDGEPLIDGLCQSQCANEVDA